MGLKKSKKGTPVEETAQEPVRHEWPSPVKPSALLVPRYVIENNAADKTRRIAVLGVGAVALVAVLGIAFAFMAAITSKTELTKAEGNRDSAQVNVDRLAEVAQYYDGLDQRSTSILGLLTNDIAHANLLRSFQQTMPNGVTFSSYNPVVGTPCPGPDPFSVPDSLGCITVEVSAQNQQQVATLLSNIEQSKDGLLSDPFVSGLNTSQGEGGSTVEFSLSVNFSAAAYSNKFADLASQPGTTPGATPGTAGATGDTTGATTAPGTPTETTGGTQ